MSTLFFHRANDYTGSTRALASIIELEHPNKNIIVVTLDINGGGFLTDIKNVKIKKIYFPLYQNKQIKYVSYILSKIHLFFISFSLGFRFDSFYINTIVPYPSVIAGRMMRKRIIYHIHEKFIDNSIEKIIIEFVFNNVKSNRIFVSNYLLHQYPHSKNNYVVKYNYLPMSFINEVNISPIKFRNLKNIIMISSLSEAKGVFIFVELASKMIDFNFTLIVSASQKEIISHFGFTKNNNLNIISSQSNIHPFLKNSHLLLNLSIPTKCVETFGLTILEAMIYGIPAIVPNVGGPLELVIDGYNGYCIDVTDLNELMNKVKTILSKDNYESFANNAIKQASKFSSTNFS
jgi:glycosyltransferase involved in cell wall biosynthesis